ncbi:MAG: isoprenylcysteine carboxylmethyltransferase family protein [Anaerolineales bacterium]
MLPLIYTHPAAAGLFLAICLVWLVPEMTGMLRQMGKVSTREALSQDRGSLGILLELQWTGLILNFLLAWLLPQAAILWQRTTLYFLGLSVILLGMALRWYAIRVLGGYFTRVVAVSKDQQVIQHGPYRHIRHPAYSGTFLTMLGVGLVMTNWASLITLLVCVFLGHIQRVSVEEKALIQTIGQPYSEYMRHTKRFIPWVF